MTLARMRGKKLPQRLGSERGPLMAAAVDGDEHDAAVVGTSGVRRGDRTAGGSGRSTALINIAPERVHIRHRRTVDDAEALPPFVGNKRIRGAVNRHDRSRVR